MNQWRNYPPRFNHRGDVHCRKCNRYLPRDWFGAEPRTADGLQSRCHECQAARARSYRRRWTDEEYRAYLDAQNARRAKRIAERNAERIRYVADVVRLLRARGWRVVDLAAELGVTRDTVYRWARSERVAFPQHVEALSALLWRRDDREAA